MSVILHDWKTFWNVAATLLYVALPAVVCRADVWQWTKASEHHAAVVRVKTRADARGQAYAGTGTVVAVDRGREPPTCLVVTAAHVVETASDGTITWADGATTHWRILQRDASQDVAVLLAWAPDNPPAPISVADQAPPAGAMIEICGYGGPDKRLRHFAAPLLTADETRLSADQYVISGDSGGAMLYAGQLVGVVYGGAGQRGAVRAADGSTWNLVYPASSRAGFYPIRRILAQVWQPWMSEHAFPNYGAASCPGGVCPSPYAPGGGSNLSPPPATSPPATSPPVTSPPAQCQPVDYDKLVELLIERIRDDERFRGPAGPQGEKGDAANIDIQALTIALTERMAGDERFRGPQGPPGRDAEIDVEQLAETIAAKLPPITFQAINGQGEVQDSVTVGLGGTVPIYHKPIPSGK